MEIDRAQEACLCRMSMDPAQRQQALPAYQTQRPRISAALKCIPYLASTRANINTRAQAYTQTNKRTCLEFHTAPPPNESHTYWQSRLVSVSPPVSER